MKYEISFKISFMSVSKRVREKTKEKYVEFLHNHNQIPSWKLYGAWTFFIKYEILCFCHCHCCSEISAFDFWRTNMNIWNCFVGRLQIKFQYFHSSKHFYFFRFCASKQNTKKSIIKFLKLLCKGIVKAFLVDKKRESPLKKKEKIKSFYFSMPNDLNKCNFIQFLMFLFACVWEYVCCFCVGMCVYMCMCTCMLQQNSGRWGNKNFTFTASSSSTINHKLKLAYWLGWRQKSDMKKMENRPEKLEKHFCKAIKTNLIFYRFSFASVFASYRQWNEFHLIIF